MGLISVLRERGLIADVTDDRLDEMLPLLGADADASKRITGYAGFDPTSNSLTIGNLVPLLGLMRLQRAGHTPIALVGGGTGLIGDPSGKTEERKLMSTEIIEGNVAAIRIILDKYLDFSPSAPNRARLLDNAEWICNIKLTHFLRDIGKYFNIAYMLSKDSVKTRLENGLSFTEFSYMLLQSYDFLELYKRYGCTLQIGGSDQYGNITAGIELIRKILAKEAFGFTFPLVTDSNGYKIGKSVSETIWLTSDRTSVYRFYQYWINIADTDVERLLYYFTFIEPEEVRSIVATHQSAPEQRSGQRALAIAVTDLIHGAEARKSAEQASAILFGGDPSQASAETFDMLAQEAPLTQLSKSVLGDGIGIADLIVQAKAATSKGEANRGDRRRRCLCKRRAGSRPLPQSRIDRPAEGRIYATSEGK